MKRSGQADMPLHYGRVPDWLYERMSKMGRAITTIIVQEYGQNEFLSRISDPFWFQAFGAVMGMDWHSSGITTSVMGALKQGLNPIFKELGIFICGGRGKYSRMTPHELTILSENSGLNGDELVRCSKLTAKVDNTAIQDRYQLYLHSFIVTNKGEWAVIQQGMNDINRTARRYHWHSVNVRSFVDEPHNSIYGINQGMILNLTDKEAYSTRTGILDITNEKPDITLSEIKKLVMPPHHDVKKEDVDLKRLGAVLGIAYEKKFRDFEDLLLLEGLGPKTLRSLTLVSEVIHGTPSRFKDPARFSFAHGGKDGKPFPVQTKVYDNTIRFLMNALHLSKIGYYDKQRAIKKLTGLLEKLEKNFIPSSDLYEKYIRKEVDESPFVGGKTVFDKRDKKNSNQLPSQLRLF